MSTMKARSSRMRTTLITAMALTSLGMQARGEDRQIDSAAGRVRVQTFVDGLDHPWGMAFLPGGAMLVTERSGQLRRISAAGVVSDPIPGVPAVFTQGQGGLLDVVLDPDFRRNRWVYLSFSEPGEAGTAGTAVARGQLVRGALRKVQVIFRQQPKVDGPNHFGSRLAFGTDRSLFVTMGERFMFSPAQDLGSHLGKIVRIRPTGKVPRDNPFVKQPGVRPEIWSYGHRNVEGAAVQPGTGRLWVSELGPMGGDELNLVRPGRNYGWPLVSWGTHYTGESIPKPPTRPDLADAQYQWTPVVSPSGMSFYTGSLFPAWKGNLLMAALSGQELVRLELKGTAIKTEERLGLDHRLRLVRQAPDGSVYLLTDEDNGQILRLTPGS